MIQSVADYLGDYEGEVPWGTLHERAKACDFTGVPEPFSLKWDPPGQYSMQVFIATKPDGKHDILKDVNLLGVPTRTDSCLQDMLAKLEGYQLRRHAVVPKAGRGASRKPADWELKEAGCKFIRGPRTNDANQFMAFADRESSRPESPIIGWEENRIERAINNKAKGTANAKGLKIWVLTTRGFGPWFLDDVIKPILASTLRAFGVAWIGKTRVKKSAGSKTLAFMMSRVEIEELEQSREGEAGELVPTIVTAKHFDLFKGEPMTRVRPAIFDDGELADQSASILKTFLTPSEEDATIWARWGCSEFDTGSPRQVSNNAYDKHFE
ncbi:unnamed protein product, partial [Prorocentrum cordatum]